MIAIKLFIKINNMKPQDKMKVRQDAADILGCVLIAMILSVITYYIA